MEIHTIGIDLAKTVFHLVVGLNGRGEVVVRKKFSQLQPLRFTTRGPGPSHSFLTLGTCVTQWQPRALRKDASQATARIVKEATGLC